MLIAHMNRVPALALRLTRAVVGLVTIWCLGCVAYEPIVDSFSVTGMVSATDCDSRRVLEYGQLAIVSVGAVVIASSVSAAPSESGFDCCCGALCHAVCIAHETSSVPQLTVPLAVHDQPTEPASVTRSPLLPPPQRTA